MIAALSATSRGQIVTTFSIDYRGPTNGTGPGFTAGDILSQIMSSPSPTPGLSLPAGPGGLDLPAYGTCSHAPGDDECVEVDALSYGNDVLIPENGVPRGSVTARRWWFSVDEWALGITGSASAPNVATEGSAGAQEASADLFVDLLLSSGPLPPPATTPGPLPEGCRGAIDGDDRFSSNLVRYPGLGLVEPNPATSCTGFPCPALGDDVDAVDVDGPPGNIVFFSLDSGISDPLLGIPNTNSAADNSGFIVFTGADVIRKVVGGGAQVFAAAGLLGLSVRDDDLDALILRDLNPNAADPATAPGDGLYQLARRPYAWNFAPPATKDMLLFSVRRGSSVIGAPDSIWGLPIEPGDILVPPVIPSYVRPDGVNAVGGVYPGIFIAAENFGLLTARTHGPMGVVYGDDIDALDISVPVLDCAANDNDVEDAIDLVYGASLDCNWNGVPDECDLGTSATYCTAGTTSSGCVPSISGNGVPDANAGSGFTIQVGAVEGQKSGILFYGLSGPLAAPWGSGSSYLCVAPSSQRMGSQNSGGNAGQCNGSLATDWNAFAASPGVLGNPFQGGECVWAQGWFRDPAASKTTNLSDALSFVVQP